ncbi:bile acid:sodium symporter family protein [Sediminitomix flava]|uniref:BASS family bile acid:Na+ symporter n=1 Tax=Sediminitomix flava TaxID=379075 RepID=A0A315ZWG7_SEDFL|nr:bile acid:sodium symporter family protein [Sediminitomix flava]PWJ41033.1 BASS family bile acid:Na+ symporter [Sediminitomix flava]
MEKSFLSEVFLPLSLFIIMLGMGLSLVPSDFRRVLVYPKAVLIGMLNQMVLLPLIGFGLAIAFNLPAALAVGLVLLAVCPGGVTSNLFSHLSKGDTALSITLTAISSIMTIFTIPLVMNFALDYFQLVEGGKVIEMDIPKTLLQLVVITIVPVSLGMVIRNYKAEFALKMEKPVKILSAAFLALIVIGLLVKERENVLGFFQQVGLSALILNAGTMFLGFAIAFLFKLSRKQSVTISIETGIQNGTMAIVIATSILNSSEMAITPAVYSLIMFATGAVAVFLFNKGRNTDDVVAEEKSEAVL